MDYQRHISRDSKICGGQPVIHGTRVMLKTVLASLAEGGSFGKILDDFPTITEADLRAVIAFAAASTAEDMPTGAAPAFQIA